MHKKYWIIVCLFCFQFSANYAQKVERVVVSNQDPFGLYNFEPSDTSSLFYLKLVPKTKPKGVLVILPASGELVEQVMQQITLHKLAVNQGLVVVFPSINWGTNTFVEEHQFLDVIFKQLVEQYQIPKDKFILGGLSGGGMVSLTYAEKAHRDNSTYIVPKAIFALDPPLDLADLYKNAKRDIQRNVSQAAVNEGHWIMSNYETEFGGTPEQVPAQYIKYSIYSHSESDGGNAKYLMHTPLRIYTEPGIEWQILNRHRDLYDLNCTNISAMINLLRNQGNAEAEIVVTHDKGVRLNGTKHPHSWSIMDSKGCLGWVLDKINH